MPAVEEEEVSRRDHIRKLILSNQIDDVISEARKVDQTVFENNLELLFALRCQKVVRLIKNQMFEEAITVAKE